jgi:hypothetical protein
MFFSYSITFHHIFYIYNIFMFIYPRPPLSHWVRMGTSDLPLDKYQNYISFFTYHYLSQDQLISVRSKYVQHNVVCMPCASGVSKLCVNTAPEAVDLEQ